MNRSSRRREQRVAAQRAARPRRASAGGALTERAAQLEREALEAYHAGDLERAEAASRALLTDRPAHPLALHVLSGVALRVGQPEEAVEYGRQALRHWAAPPAEAHNMLGAALIRLGRYREAVAACRDAVKTDPANGGARSNLLQSLLALGRDRELVNVRSRWGEQSPADRVLQAIAEYQQGAVEACEAGLRSIDGYFAHPPEPLPLPADVHRHLNVYHDYLSRLVAWRRSQVEVAGEPEQPTLHVVGDSHCLGTAGVEVVVDGRVHRAQPRLVMGAKAWHLGSAPFEQYRAAFELAVDSLPADAPVLLMFGEIDCRLGEGIQAQLAGDPRLDLAEQVAAVVSSYVRYVADCCAGRARAPIIYGVPAPNPGSEQATVAGDVIADIVAAFNSALKAAAQAHGLPFVDVYAFTAAADGFARDGQHIDSHHLMPDVFSTVMAEREANGAVAA